MEGWGDTFMRHGYIALAAIAGAITALGSAHWREMKPAEIMLMLITGFSFAIFVTPWVAHSIFGIDEGNTRAIAGLTYLFGSGWNLLLPVAIRKIKRMLGDGDAQ